jgi:mRNA interferase MazF
MKRGEIRWYTFSHPDKKRPVLIVSRNSVIGYLNEITIAPITSIVRDIPSEVLLSKDDGMENECAVNCDHLQTVLKLKLGHIIATLPSHRMADVRKAIAFALEL